MLRKRRRREKPRRGPTWELLCLPVTFLAFIVGHAVFPRAPSPWSNALAWIVFGGVVQIVVLVADFLLRQLMRRAITVLSARDSPSRRPSFVLRSPTYFTVYVVCEELRPSALPRIVVFVAVATALVIAEASWARFRERGEAARLRAEAEELAEHF